MDIAKIAVAASEAKIRQQASMAVMKMALDEFDNGANDLIGMMHGMTQAMERSVQANLGGNVDILA